MNKGVTLGKNDAGLIEKIIKYQHEKEIPNFTETVRKLEKISLETAEAEKK